MRAELRVKTFSGRAAILMLIAAVNVACSSKDLSRSDAEGIIKESAQYPNEITSFISAGYLRYNSSFYYPHTNELNQSGLVTVSTSSDQYSRQMSINLTDAGKKYMRKQTAMGAQGGFDVATYICNLGEVTGIAYNNNEKTLAKVEYTEVCEPTPFGKLSIFANKNRDEPRKKEIMLQLYDDGWRKI